ncbi:hypothetical protein GCM10007231_33840 [Nocardioides daphniae]|uniref:DUF4440 domain-containing protein n=1 Tax=Nocardioides daphniae TaxID=402297 RepID=A0ABQ1QKR4_9ACTN|nr:hypothetical protein GCM10007231_33840 [Nocardioides daphniae]
MAAVLCVVGTFVIWLAGERDVSPAAPAQQQPRTPVELLHAWDEARSQAWREGDVDALRRLYVDGARVGRTDAAMLRAYVERGLVVEGMTTQLLEVEELRVEADLVVLDVTDRLYAGTVVGPDVRRALPRDAPSRRRVTLRRSDGTWRVAKVVHRTARGET